MKTELMLLAMTDGRPTLNLKECAELTNMTTGSFRNRIYAKKPPFPVFQLDGSAEWCAHVADVAAYIDRKREEATKEFEAAE
jgi:hypothetical protein